MAVFSEPFTNLYGDGEVSGSSPDAQGDFYLLTDAQADHNYLQEKIADAISALSTTPTGDFLIIYGGVVSDGGSGTINISECLCKTKDTNGKKRLVYIPALTGIALPSGWNDGRSIWVTARYDFKLGTLTRTHKLGGSYHYQIADTYMGDAAGYISTGPADLFTTSDPVATATMLGKFTMTGTTFVDLGVRSPGLFMSSGGIITNVALGIGALDSNTIGANNIAIGKNALTANTTGYGNIALGEEVLDANTIGYDNFAAGYAVLGRNTTGYSNIAIGSSALYGNTTGILNIAIGFNALKENITGSRNTAIGTAALDSNTLGTYNSAIGYGALSANTTGTHNTAIGYNAGVNIAIGTNNTAIGHNSQASSSSVSNEITLGNSSIATLRCQVTSITALSDERDKTDIKDCDLGLNFINTIKPVKFRWDKREWYSNNIPDGSKKSENYTYNFIAQELDEIQQKFNANDLNLVYKSNPDKLEATPGNLIPILTKAIQELSRKIDDQQKEINILKGLPV